MHLLLIPLCPLLIRRLLQPMRNAELSPLLGVLDALVALLPHAHRLVLHVHPVDVQCLRHCVDGVGEEARPGREEVREGGGGFEVGCEGECC